jgi:Domain of unknown function (DUF6916)
MPVSRRRFLESVLFASVVAPVKSITLIEGQGDSSLVANANVATFKPRIGDTFWLHLEPATPVQLTLLSVTPYTYPAPVPTPQRGVLLIPPPCGWIRYLKRTTSFELHFHAVNGAEGIKQGTYLLENNTLGRFELFLIPMGNESYRTFSAVINHLPAY